MAKKNYKIIFAVDRNIKSAGRISLVLNLSQQENSKLIELNGTTSVSVDINNLPKGTYDVILKGNSVNEQQKFVKE